MHPHVHCIIIYNLSVHQRMHKENMGAVGGIVYTYTHREEYYQTVKKEWNLGIFDNMDKTWGDYAKWNKSEKDKYTVISLYWNKKKPTKQTKSSL